MGDDEEQRAASLVEVEPPSGMPVSASRCYEHTVQLFGHLLFTEGEQVPFTHEHSPLAQHRLPALPFAGLQHVFGPQHTAVAPPPQSVWFFLHGGFDCASAG
jgi:hypothetical protein